MYLIYICVIFLAEIVKMKCACAFHYETDYIETSFSVQWYGIIL